jgi:hypothetical protein
MRNILAKLFHDTIGRVIALVREIWFSQKLRNNEDGVYEVSPKPPYISQLANAQRDKIQGFYEAINDQEAAKRFGEPDLDKFSYWAWRSCGIVGVQMVLLAQLGRIFTKSTMDLVNEGLSIGGYDVKYDKGWYHTALVQAAQKHGITSRLSKFVSASQVAKLVLDGNYVLASIKSERGGHLLLIYGVRIKNAKLISFIVHDPNNFTEDGDSKEVSKVSFENLFTRRIVIFENKEGRSAKPNRV